MRFIILFKGALKYSTRAAAAAAARDIYHSVGAGARFNATPGAKTLKRARSAHIMAIVRRLLFDFSFARVYNDARDCLSLPFSWAVLEEAREKINMVLFCLRVLRASAFVAGNGARLRCDNGGNEIVGVLDFEQGVIRKRKYFASF